jgi:hypothetical protein
MARGYGEREPIGGLASIEIIGGARALLPMEVYAYVCNKANKRLHFLKLGERSAMSTDDSLYYFKSIIKPVVEYVCPIW